MSGPDRAMQKGRFADGEADVTSMGRIEKRTARLDGIDVAQLTFPPGASVAEDAWRTGLQPTPHCELPHVAYVVSGSLGVRMRDGSEERFDAGDVMLLPPGHEAWTVGDEACVFVQFSRGADLYAAGADPAEPTPRS